MNLLEQPFQLLHGLPLTAFVTSRKGGVSQRPFDTLNMAYLTADDRGSVRTNRERVAMALGIAHDNLLIGHQVHGAIVNQAEAIELGETPGDAIVLTRAHQTAMVVVADCLPVIFYDPVAHVGAVAHAGWRGLAAGILTATVQSLMASGAIAGRLAVGIGPGIGRCCYEVGPEVIAASKPAPGGVRAGSADRSFLDIKALARRQLETAGLASARIEILDICTRCNSDLYFSARAGEPTGRFAAGLKLLEEPPYNVETWVDSYVSQSSRP
ncbi:MAG: peptidoglycan editing factor PgeF [Dehalococcoidia bacterium]|nr:peptidoglycan editing factor PgeF [Dehalococcoidia bacterium]